MTPTDCQHPPSPHLCCTVMPCKAPEWACQLALPSPSPLRVFIVLSRNTQPPPSPPPPPSPSASQAVSVKDSLGYTTLLCRTLRPSSHSAFRRRENARKVWANFVFYFSCQVTLFGRKIHMLSAIKCIIGITAPKNVAIVEGETLS